jgi:hypothetical protein
MKDGFAGVVRSLGGPITECRAEAAGSKAHAFEQGWDGRIAERPVAFTTGK